LAALTQDDGSVEKMRKTFEKRRNFLVDKLNKIEHIKCLLPKGAFYTMPNVAYYLNNKKNINTSAKLCEYLLREYRIALVPGSAFGAEKYIRFSYATSMENIEEGVKRLEKGLKNLL